MFSLPSPPACRKRKSSSNAPLTPNKRVRLVGSFEPRLIVPTGARRSWTFAKVSRFILDPVTQGVKRSLIEEEITSSLTNCKVRLLDNRDVLFLPSQERRATKKPQRKRTPSSSPTKKSVEFVRLRRREFIRKQQLQRVDSGICMESDEDIALDTEPMSSLESGGSIKFFGAIDASTFTGFSVEMMEATETVTQDDMEIEDASISTTTTAASTTEGDADSDSTPTEQATSSSKDNDNKDMPVDEIEEEGKSEVKKLDNDVEIEDAEKKTTEQKDANNKLSTKDTAIKERIQKRLGVDELVRLNPSSSKRGIIKKVMEEEDEDDEDDEPPRRSTRRKTVKPSLPTTVEEDEENEREQEDDDDAVVVVKRRSSRSSLKGKEEEKEKKGKEDESDREEKKEEKKEKKKMVRRKAKVEESESESEKEEERKPKKERKEVKEEKKESKEEAKVEEIEGEVEGDKMEEDTDEDSTSSRGDTDMSTDEDVTDFISEEKSVVEDPVEEDVTMSEDDEMAEEEDNEESKDIETADAADDANEGESSEKGRNNLLQVPTIEIKKTVRRLVLTPTKKEEYEISKMLSVPRTPRTPGPRSPSMSRFNITMSKAPRKLDPLLSPRRKKFIKSEDLSPHWTMKRLAAKKRQQPFNPANISRHAYRDPINEDELYNIATRKAFWDEDELEDPYADEQCLRVEWTRKSWGNSWMMENGCALIDFCVRALEGFNMAW